MASSKNQERDAREARDRLKRYTARQSVHATQVTRRRRDNIAAVVGVLVIVALAAVAQVFYFAAGPGMPTPTPSASAEAGANVGDVPAPDLAEGRTWTGELGLNAVTLGIELDGAAAPQAVAAFIDEVNSDYFLGKSCHRLVVSDSAGLIQCGSLDGTGASDPEFSFGPIENAPVDGVYAQGVIAMARAGDNAYSQGRQFFIVFQDATLPNDSVGGYTVIGTVTSGLDALVSTIVAGGVADGASDGAPVIPTTITTVSIN